MSEINIPKNWALTELGQISDYINGRAFKSSEWSKKGLPIIRIQNLTNKRVKNEFNYFDGEYDKKILIKNGDLLFCWSGTLSIIRYSGVDALLNQHIFKVILNQNVDSNFFFYQLKHLIDRIYEDAHGVGLMHITKEKLLKIPFILPPLKEQSRIVQKIDSVLSEIEILTSNLLRAKKLLSLFKKSYYNKQVEILNLVRLEELIKSPPKNGYSPLPSEKPTKTKSLKLSATSSGKLDLSHTKYISEEIPHNSNFWLKNGDILIQRANSLNLIGATAIFDGPEKEYIYPDLMMKINSNEKALPEYLTFCLQLSSTQLYFQENASGAAANMPKINQQVVLGTPIPITSIEEQRRILQSVNNMNEAYDLIEQTINEALTKVELFQKSILIKAFEGRLVDSISTENNGHELLLKINQEKENFEKLEPSTKTRKKIIQKTKTKTKINAKDKKNGKK